MDLIMKLLLKDDFKKIHYEFIDAAYAITLEELEKRK